jgi:hypothetical protein
MQVKYNLTPELRTKLKKPLGTLIRGSFNDTMKRFSYLVKAEKPSCIISVGDTVSKNLAKNGFLPKLSIIDNKCMRRRTQSAWLETEKTLYVENPQATITEEAITAIQGALQGSQHVKIVVEGEEDLLTLIAIMYAPQNSFVLYGQPREGIVLVRVTEDKRAEAIKILEAMEKSSKD